MRDKTSMSKKQTGQLVQASEILESISDGVFTLDREWRFSYLNKRAAGIMNLQPKDLLRQNIWEKYPLLKGTEIEGKYRKAMDEGQSQEFETESVPDGTWFHIRVYPSPQGITVYWQDITARRAAEEALKKSEEKYRSLFDNMTESFAMLEPVFDANGELSNFRIQEINESAAKLLGLTKEYVKGKTFLEIDPNYEIHWKENFSRVALTGEPAHIIQYSGYIDRWLEVYAYMPWKGIVAVIVTDITESKKIEETIRENNQKLSQLSQNLANERQRLFEVLDNLPVMVCLLTPGYHIIYANRAFKEKFGEPEGRHCYEYCFGYSSAPCPFCESFKVLETGQPHHWESTSKDGETIIDVYDFPFKDIDGSPLILEMDIDITQQREKEQLYRTLFDNTEEGFQLIQPVYDKNGQTVDYLILRVNPTYEKHTGLKADQVVGKTIKQISPGIDQSWFDFIDKMNETGQPVRNENYSQLTHRWYEVYHFPHPKGKVGVLLRDITQRKEAEEALAEANKQLKQYARRITQVQEEERKRIAYELHDDTAQYLSILKMQIGNLAESPEIRSPQVKDKLKYLEKDADRAFNDVRRYSHELRPTTLEHQGLVAALEQIADDFNKLGQLSVEVRVEGMEPELSEETKLGFFRIAQEALNNARKHSKAGHADVDIRFNHKQIRMAVSDNGEGFDVKQALRRSKGKGSMGLMSMRERADLINAILKIKSEPGNGTTVIVKART